MSHVCAISKKKWKGGKDDDDEEIDTDSDKKLPFHQIYCTTVSLFLLLNTLMLSMYIFCFSTDGLYSPNHFFLPISISFIFAFLLGKKDKQKKVKEITKQEEEEKRKKEKKRRSMFAIFGAK